MCYGQNRYKKHVKRIKELFLGLNLQIRFSPIYFFCNFAEYMKKSFEQIEKDILSKDIQPIYLLTGAESFYIDILSEQFENKILDESEKDFNLLLIYGKDTSSEIILNFSKQYPIMSDYRIIIIKEAQDLDKRDWVNLESYFKNPNPQSILVICYKYNKFPVNLIKIIDKKGIVFESQKVKDYKLTNWISDYTKSLNLDIDNDAINIISESLGNNLEKISNEISKLILNINQGERITSKHIEKYIGISRNYNVFELQTALGKRDIFKANQIINYFEYNQKDNPIVLIISNLYSYFLKLIIVTQLSDKSDSSISQKIGCYPSFAKDYRNAVNIYNINKLYQIIGLLREYDLKSKGLDSGQYLSYGDLLKELIFKITH